MIDGFNGQYRFLSNFHPCEIDFEEVKYPSVENAYQAAKTDNQDHCFAISIMTPAKAKSMGRSLKIREDWDDVKVVIMKRLLVKKFRDIDLAHKLVDTYPNELVEGNYWHDNFWGRCTCLRCLHDHVAVNHLGLLLMEVRQEILVGITSKA